MPETLMLAITAFVGTNIDDLFINALFFSEEQTNTARVGIVWGKYLGMGLLVFLSFLGGLGLQFLPRGCMGLLGLLPIALGIRELVGSLRSKEDTRPDASGKSSANPVLNVTLITMANGADNLGVYIPLFAGFSLRQGLLCLGVFFLMTGLWCFLGKTLADLPVLKRLLGKYKRVIVPLVYMALGVYILVKSLR